MILKIKSLRLAANLTQAALAERVGVARNSVSVWETETSLPPCAKLPEIADALGVSVGELFADGESA